MKVFEKVVRKKIVNFFDENNSFNVNQHGFRSGRSCLSQLLAHYDYILSQLEQGNNVDIIYLDFAKAFDKVDHGILLHKLRAMGIKGKLGTTTLFSQIGTNMLLSIEVNRVNHLLSVECHKEVYLAHCFS